MNARSIYIRCFGEVVGWTDWIPALSGLVETITESEWDALCRADEDFRVNRGGCIQIGYLTEVEVLAEDAEAEACRLISEEARACG